MHDLSASRTRWDAIVVGSGLGGLATAAYLATNGKRVLLVEQYDVIGGCAHVFRRKKQWEFDVGVHYIENAGPGGQMSSVLAGLGLSERVEFLEMDRDGFDTILGPDFELRIPRGWDAYLENLIEAFPNEERALRRYVRAIRALAPARDRSSSQFSSAPGAARMISKGGLRSPLYFLPWAMFLSGCGLTPRATLALSVQVATYATAPHTVPVAMHASWLEEFLGGGAWYPRGGTQNIAGNLVQVIRAHGGTVRSRARVEQILIESGRVRGVRLEDGEELASEVVVSDADIKRTMLELVGPKHLSPLARRRASRWKMSWPFVNTYFGLERDLRGEANTNYFVIPSWEPAESMLKLARLFPDLVMRGHRRTREEWANDFARRQIAYVQCSTARDPANDFSAPAGCAAVQAMTLVPGDLQLWGVAEGDLESGSYRRGAAYREMKQRLTEAMLDRVERAYPGARGQVRWSEAATPATQRRYTGATGGAAFGLDVRPSQFGPFRPRSKTPIRGLYLAGTSTAWGPGSSGALLSGMHAAGAVLGRDLNAEVRSGAVFGDSARLGPMEPDWDPLQASRRLGRPDQSEEAIEDPDLIGVDAG